MLIIVYCVSYTTAACILTTALLCSQGLADEISGVPVAMHSDNMHPMHTRAQTFYTDGSGAITSATKQAATYTTLNSHKVVSVSRLQAFGVGARQHLWNPVAPVRAYTKVMQGWHIASRWYYSVGSKYGDAVPSSTQFLGVNWEQLKSAWNGNSVTKLGRSYTDNDFQLLRCRRLVHAAQGPVQVAVTLIDSGSSYEFKARVRHLTNANEDYLYTHYVVSGAAYQWMKSANDYSFDSKPIGRYYTNGANDYAMIDELGTYPQIVGGLSDLKWFNRDVPDVDLEEMYRTSPTVVGLSVSSSYADHVDGVTAHYWGMGGNNGLDWTTPDGLVVPGSTNSLNVRRCSRATQQDICVNGYSMRDSTVDPRDGSNLNCYVNWRYYVDGCYQDTLSFNSGASNPSSGQWGISDNYRLPGGYGWDNNNDFVPATLASRDSQTPYVAAATLDECKRQCEHVMCRMLTYMTLAGGKDDRTCVLFQTIKSRNGNMRMRFYRQPNYQGGLVSVGNERHGYHGYFTPHQHPADPGYAYTTLIAQHRLVHVDGLDETRHFGDLLADQVPENWWKGSGSSDTDNYTNYGSVLHWTRQDSEGLRGAYYNEPRGRNFVTLEDAFSAHSIGPEVYHSLHGGYHADQRCASICQHINTQPNGGYLDRQRYSRSVSSRYDPVYCYG